MVKAREWLERKYPNKEEVELIDFSDLKADEESELIVDRWPNLKQIRNYGEKSSTDWEIPVHTLGLTKITITNCPELNLIHINRLLKLKEVIISNLPNLGKLYFSDNISLKEIKIVECPELWDLFCNESIIESLDLSHFPNLQIISCRNNLLQEIKLPLNRDELREIKLANNNFPSQDLSIFKGFLYLEKLDISNLYPSDVSEEGTVINRFHGSLEPLKEIITYGQKESKEGKKERVFLFLNISNTDIDSGLEYLPLGAEVVCEVNQEYRPNSKVKAIAEQLKSYRSDIKDWQKDKENGVFMVPWQNANSNLIITARNAQIFELENQLQSQKDACSEVQKKINELHQKTSLDEVENFFKEVDESCEELKKQNQQKDEVLKKLLLNLPDLVERKKTTTGINDSWKKFKKLLKEREELTKQHRQKINEIFNSWAEKDKKIANLIEEKFDIYEKVVFESMLKDRQIMNLKAKLRNLGNSAQIQVPPK
ncbi:hypothetical protein [endosymbiont GvMRE of Glomus versiforme]|uniref:hypothetical protein n=1 Tax=endosymbiont GvMRE of Glomus versiforme TaxID=2039283 RepID=UPI000ED6449D|nr:hypothetical protein [endosymbiont GvMRE of Glomus versiforme]RHZ36036.1 HET domain protein [endosymbiont GvMRE of Glomus versiforme]